jgi:GNAT superfamily N-acetyltransferase
MFQIRRLADDDLPFAQQLSGIAGWNQTAADWRRLIDLGGAGCFLIQCDGQRAGTATTIIFANQLAWIGMVLVHPSFRRRGLATALLRHCLEYLCGGQGVGCVKLDATVEGQPLYAGLGFQHDYLLARWEGSVADLFAGDALDAEAPTVGRTIEASHSDDWLELDRRIFAVDRSGLLHRLAPESLAAIEIPGQGYGMLRSGSRAAYLGPVVAADEATGRQLVAQLLMSLRQDAGADLQPGRDDRVYWDIPQSNTAAERLAQQLGLVQQRPLVRMWTGNANIADDPAGQWAIAGPETG